MNTTGFMIVTPRFPRVKSPMRKELDTEIDATKAGPAGVLWAGLKSRVGFECRPP